MIRKAIKYFLILIILLSLAGRPVLAYPGHVIDFTKKGNLQVTLKELTEQKPIKGAEISLYQIADAYSKDNQLSLKYISELNDCTVNLDNLDTPNIAKELNNCLTDHAVIKHTVNTGEEGIANFSNLPLGLYLVKQTKGVKGYSNIDPFLVMIPKDIDNEWKYDIKAKPKTDIIYLFDLTVQKRWNVPEGTTLPRKVEIELYKDSELIDTVILNEECNWMHTWIHIEKSDKYHVKEKNVPEGYEDIYQKEENKLIVINSKKLANTGFNIYVPVLLAVSGSVLILLGTITQKRKRYE